MNRKSSRKRSRERSGHSSFALSLLVALSLIGCVVFLPGHSSLFRSSNSLDARRGQAYEIEKLTRTDLPSAGSFETDASREIYPYSVVPGGVRTPNELQQASAHDPVVGAHYAGFDFRTAKLIKVRQARLVYLSYRIGDKIYWTTKRVSLRKGEDLITDGKITARTRCGNRVSELPQKNTSRQEPAIALFDKPVGGNSTRIPFPEDFHSALDSRPAPRLSTLALGPASPLFAADGVPPGTGFLPIGSPLAPGGSGSTNSGGAAGTGGPGPPSAPVSVPEPGALALICAEIFALTMILCWKVASRNRSNRSLD
ncbi:MAG: hypothetical protein ACRD2U_08410 [Terriglobales bacterium]